MYKHMEIWIQSNQVVDIPILMISINMMNNPTLGNLTMMFDVSLPVATHVMKA